MQTLDRPTVSPALAGAISKILATAARAALAATSDRELLAALDEISGEVRAAEYEYHGHDEYQPTAEDLASLDAGDLYADADVPY